VSVTSTSGSPFLQRELDRLRDLQKTPREHVDSSQVQLAFAEMAKQLLEEAEARGTADKEEGESGGAGDPKRKRNHTRHGRAVCPSTCRWKHCSSSRSLSPRAP
jgi:hypothetical protein